MACHSVARARGLDDLRATGLRGVSDAFAAHLARRNLGPVSVETYLRAAAHFGRWLDRTVTGVAVSQEMLSSFLVEHLPHCRCRGPVQRSKIVVRAALRHLEAVLRAAGRLDEPVLEPTPIDIEVERFDVHMVDVCGLADSTRRRRRYDVRRLLEAVFGDGPVKPRRLCARHVREFVTSHGDSCCPGTLAVIAGSMRSYLRFLQFGQRCPAGLEAAVPRIAQWRLATVPVHLHEDQVGLLLSAFDTTSARGRRDHAIALCMVVLGLRAIEVASLRLRDVDWRIGALSVPPTKTVRGRRLPLPQSVGFALATYVRRARPSTTCDRLFVRIGIRQGEELLAGCVQRAMRAAYRRAGLPASWGGAHRLRHTAATRLVRSGASAKEVADMLGHASLQSTALYAKVDLPALRRVALAWPRRTP